MQEAMVDPHFRARGLFGRKTATGSGALTAMPVPVDDAFRSAETTVGYPRLGADNDLLKG
jgi:hypothetical protein